MGSPCVWFFRGFSIILRKCSYTCQTHRCVCVCVCVCVCEWERERARATCHTKHQKSLRKNKNKVVETHQNSKDNSTEYTYIQLYIYIYVYVYVYLVIYIYIYILHSIYIYMCVCACVCAANILEDTSTASILAIPLTEPLSKTFLTETNQHISDCGQSKHLWLRLIKTPRTHFWIFHTHTRRHSLSLSHQTPPLSPQTHPPSSLHNSLHPHKVSFSVPFHLTSSQLPNTRTHTSSALSPTIKEKRKKSKHSLSSKKKERTGSRFLELFPLFVLEFFRTFVLVFETHFSFFSFHKKNITNTSRKKERIVSSHSLFFF